MATNERASSEQEQNTTESGHVTVAVGNSNREQQEVPQQIGEYELSAEGDQGAVRWQRRFTPFDGERSPAVIEEFGIEPAGNEWEVARTVLLRDGAKGTLRDAVSGDGVSHRYIGTGFRSFDAALAFARTRIDAASQSTRPPKAVPQESNPLLEQYRELAAENNSAGDDELEDDDTSGQTDDEQVTAEVGHGPREEREVPAEIGEYELWDCPNDDTVEWARYYSPVDGEKYPAIVEEFGITSRDGVWTVTRSVETKERVTHVPNVPNSDATAIRSDLQTIESIGVGFESFDDALAFARTRIDAASQSTRPPSDVKTFDNPILLQYRDLRLEASRDGE